MAYTPLELAKVAASAADAKKAIDIEVIIAAVVAIYVVFFILFKKNKVRFQDYLEYLATGTKPEAASENADA